MNNRAYWVRVARVLNLVLLLGCIWCGLPASKPVQAEGTITLDVMLLIDHSRSMSIGNSSRDIAPSDPHSLRIQSAKFLIDILRANAGIAQANHRAGVIGFGGKVGVFVPLRLLNDDFVRDKITHELINYTDFRAPLERALRELQAKNVGSGNTGLIILFTDGHPEPAQGPLTNEEILQYFQELEPVVEAVRQEDIALFVIGIGDAEEDRVAWEQLIGAQNYRTITDMEQLPDVYYHLIADVLEMDLTEPNMLLPDTPATVNVEPGLESVNIAILNPNPTDVITVTSSSGVVMTPTMGGTPDVHHAVYTMINPASGTWTLVTDGAYESQYWVAKHYPLVLASADTSCAACGQIVRLTAQVIRQGSVFTGELVLSATVLGPEAYSQTVPLHLSPSGEYRGMFTPTVAGTYSLTTEVSHHGVLLPVRTRPIDLVVLPNNMVALATPQTELKDSSSEIQDKPTAASVALLKCILVMMLVFIAGLVLLKMLGIFAWYWPWHGERGVQELDRDLARATRRYREIQGREQAEAVFRAALERVEQRAVETAKQAAPSARELLGLRFAALPHESQGHAIFTDARNWRNGGLYLLADYVEHIRWDKAPQLAIPEIYQALEYGVPWKFLDYVGEIGLKPQASPASRAAARISDAFVAVLVAPESKLAANLPKAIAQVRDTFRDVQTILDRAADGHELYKYLGELATQVHDQPFPTATHFNTNTIESWHKTIEICEYAFALHRGFGSWRRDLKKAAREAAMIKGPEGRIVTAISNQWRERLVGVMTSPITLSLASSQPQQLNATAQSLPLVITNTGQSEVQQVSIRQVGVTTNGSTRTTLRALPGGAQERVDVHILQAPIVAIVVEYSDLWGERQVTGNLFPLVTSQISLLEQPLELDTFAELQSGDPHKPLLIGQMYPLFVGMQASDYVRPVRTDRGSLDVFEIDVIVTANAVSVRPAERQQLYLPRGREAGLCRFKIIPVRIGRHDISVDFYMERYWIDSLVIPVEIAASQDQQ